MNTYLIISDTIYFTNEMLKKINCNNDFVITFNMDECDIDDILTEASYFSMFDDDKCIVVKNAKFFSASKTGDSKKSSEITNKILKYLEKENKHSKLIFILNGKADSKKKLYQIIKENNNLFISPLMSKTDMKNELLKICKNNKYTISDKSLWHIINNSLGNFDLAYNEIKKIMLYYNSNSKDFTEIKYDDVLMLTSKTIDENNFKLVDNIINRDLNNSLKLLNELKILKVEPTIIISLIYREFKLMLMTIIYEENKYSVKDILNNLHLTDWMFEKVKNNLRLYNKKEIEEEIIKLSDLDYKLKSGTINKDLALISYIIDICL